MLTHDLVANINFPIDPPLKYFVHRTGYGINFAVAAVRKLLYRSKLGKGVVVKFYIFRRRDIV